MQIANFIRIFGIVQWRILRKPILRFGSHELSDDIGVMLLSQQTAQRTRPTDANHIGRFAGKSQTEIQARETEELKSAIQTTPARGTPGQVLPPDHDGIVVSFVGTCGRFRLLKIVQRPGHTINRPTVSVRQILRVPAQRSFQMLVLSRP
jgi:hypothetical protein